MSVWDEKYVMLAVGMPLYWITVMIPHFVKAYYGARGEKNVDKVIGEPRKYFEEVAAKGTTAAAGYVRRGTAAHQNGWEAFILYLSAVVAAFGAKINPATFNNLCALALILRLVFNFCYIQGTTITSRIRSISFLAHVITCFTLHYHAYTAIIA
eukprot:TRINITY_DN924_c0_g1_i1.p1 TRINITY_DN924_c0_g1~~TRINITY_DN924_c0_g1_i1.p1  ORF type:complete len:171 (+),score=54.98 TRINITY_DN924_c0_g1_i1:54-515(+)